MKPPYKNWNHDSSRIEDKEAEELEIGGTYADLNHPTVMVVVVDASSTGTAVVSGGLHLYATLFANAYLLMGTSLLKIWEVVRGYIGEQKPQIGDKPQDRQDVEGHNSPYHLARANKVLLLVEQCP